MGKKSNSTKRIVKWVVALLVILCIALTILIEYNHEGYEYIDPFDNIVTYDTLESSKLAYWVQCSENKDDTRMLRYAIREYYGTEERLFITFDINNEGCRYLFRYQLDLNCLKVDDNGNIHYSPNTSKNKAYFDEYVGSLHCTDSNLYKYTSWNNYSIYVYSPDAPTLYYIRNGEE